MNNMQEYVEEVDEAEEEEVDYPLQRQYTMHN